MTRGKRSSKRKGARRSDRLAVVSDFDGPTIFPMTLGQLVAPRAPHHGRELSWHIASGSKYHDN